MMSDRLDADNVELVHLFHMDLRVLVLVVQVVIGQESLNGAIRLVVLDACELGRFVDLTAELNRLPDVHVQVK